MQMNKTKICKGCGLEKLRDEFEKGMQFCISCGDEARIRSNKENKKNYSRKYRQNYPDKARAESKKSKAKQYYSDDPNIFFKYLLSHCKGRAKSRSLDFNLSVDFLIDLYEMQNNKCAVTKLSFNFEKSEFEKRPFAPSIDRIDSSKGYTQDNVRLVCAAVNYALNEFGDTVFDKICAARVLYKSNEVHNA
jgi:uncharacterized Zn finger protein (UPF0148 family)